MRRSGSSSSPNWRADGGDELADRQRGAENYAAALRSAGMTLASIEATEEVSIGSGSIWSVPASVEITLCAVFRVLLAFLGFFGCFGVEALGFLPTLTATIPLAPALTTLARPPSSRDSAKSSDSISCRRSAATSIAVSTPAETRCGGCLGTSAPVDASFTWMVN